MYERSQERFAWDPDSGPQSDSTPFPPRISSAFSSIVASTDFYLTDEHHDDNTQQALLNVADGVELLRRHHDRVLELADLARTEGDNDEKKALLKRAIGTAEAYDGEAARLEYMVYSGLADLERRLEEAGFRSQLRRTLRGRLPEGKNPPPLRGLDDPRLSEGTTDQVD